MNKPTGKIEAADPLAALRAPFAPHHISKLPKETKAQREARQANRNEGVNCQVCGGWHHKHAIHLDYVGHAALTDRLLDIDPCWTWEPVGFTPEGLPAHDKNGGLWIKLTVCGMTRYGYGCADGKTGGDAVKEIIGDALRNAAMRFGAALDLWHKGDLHPEEAHDPETGEVTTDTPEPPSPITDDQRDLIQTLAPGAGKTTQDICAAYKIPDLTRLTEAQAVKLIEKLRATAKESVNA